MDLLIPEIRKGDIPWCKDCNQLFSSSSTNPGSKKRDFATFRNSSSSLSNNNNNTTSNTSSASKKTLRKTNFFKPNIVLFGEPIPREVGIALEEDRNKVDLIIVIGSSLKVAPSKILFFSKNFSLFISYLF